MARPRQVVRPSDAARVLPPASVARVSDPVRHLRRLDLRRRPGLLAIAGFAGAITAGTVLLVLPVSKAGPGGASLLEALFTATSAVCVTGLVIVDTPTYWSPFGQAVIPGLIQLGGLGILVSASLLGLLISRRMGLQTRLLAAAETRTVGLGDVSRAVMGVLG